MLKLAKKTAEQVYKIDVNGEEISFTVRSGNLGDMDYAYVTALDEVDRANYQGNMRDQLFSIKAGRSMLMQRIIAWTGVGLPSGEDAPCTQEYLERFFMDYPGAMQKLSDAVRAWEEAVEKN